VAKLNGLLAELTSGDESRAEKAAGALAGLGEPAVPALLDLLAAPEADRRWWAVRTLAQIPDVDGGAFVRALADPSAEVRQAAALALNGNPHPDALPALILALGDPDSLVAGLAARSLVRIGNVAVPALIEAAQAGPLGARIHAMRALAELRDPRAIPVMMKSVEADSAVLKYWAEEGLQRLGLNMVYIKPG
jgi:HEAT repeat protein